MMIMNDNDNDKDNDNDDNAILIIYHDIHNNNIINDGVIHGSDINDKKNKLLPLFIFVSEVCRFRGVLTTSFPVPSSSLVHALLPSSHSLFIMLLISTYDHHKRNNSKNMKTHMNTTKQPSKTQIFKIKCSDSYSSYKQRQT